MYLFGFLSYIPIVGLMPRDWLRRLFFFLDILPCSTICSHCANILSQFTAPCDALRTWPFCFPTCWSHFINGVLFLRISAPDLDLAPGLVWAWTCQVPAALQVPPSRQCGAIPAPESLRMRFILRSGWERMLRLWRLIIHFLAPSTFFLCVYSVGGLVPCMLWYPPHTPFFALSDGMWWSTNERGLKRHLTGTGIKPSQM